MEKENQNNISEEIVYGPTKDKDSSLSTSVVVVSIVVVGIFAYMIGFRAGTQQENNVTSNKNDILVSKLEKQVLPSKGVTLPVVWGDLGIKLVDSGVIDADKFKTLYTQRGQFTEEYRKLLLDKNNGRIKITKENSGYILNLFWALGLANKNTILETGEMSDPKYGGAGKFASTGGWTIAKGNTMEHYSKHILFTLTAEQQALVEKISKGVFRPCCGNSTHFPDCNHGMAMLGLLELMASQGVSEQDMWQTALVVNSYWFPNNYLTIASYMEAKGIDWKNVNPQEILGAEYSSSSGYANIASQVAQPQQQTGGNGGSGCGLGGGTPTVGQQRQQAGCGL